MSDSPESPPAATHRAGRLAALWRLLLVGSLVLALLGPPRLADWTGSRPLLSDALWLQAAMQQLDQSLAGIRFTQGYAWLRQQTRALQGLRFNAADDNQK